jgi:hypothetical protein
MLMPDPLPLVRNPIVIPFSSLYNWSVKQYPEIDIMATEGYTYTFTRQATAVTSESPGGSASGAINIRV